MSETVMIKCEFENNFAEDFNDGFYTCIVNGQAFHRTRKYQFDVVNCRDVTEVQAIQFVDCNMPKIPENFPWNQFPNLQILEINESNFKKICKEDFNGLRKENLKQILLNYSDLNYLPGDLFEGMENLEEFTLWNDKAMCIEPELIEPLLKLKHIRLLIGNSDINLSYKEDGTGDASLEQIKKEILEKCQVPEEMRQLERENLMLKHEIKNLKDQAKFSSDLKDAFRKEATKDFTINVNNQTFKVHKFLLIARSPVLAEIIENNPEGENLQLENIPIVVFKQVLDYMYNNTLPQEGVTFKDIFIAAGRLKIEKLKNFAGVKLIDQVDADNAFEMLELANKYDHEGLRLKAFGVVKGMFPDREFEDEVAKDQAIIQDLFEIKQMQDNLMKKIKAKFYYFMGKK